MAGAFLRAAARRGPPPTDGLLDNLFEADIVSLVSQAQVQQWDLPQTVAQARGPSVAILRVNSQATQRGNCWEPIRHCYAPLQMDLVAVDASWNSE